MAQSDTTEALYCQASQWSLAGDEQLLKVLQNMHQKLLTKCQEVDSKMEEMSSALDDASISLQNVNNKFMALSNSQFIESRVYDDDADVTLEATQPKAAPSAPQPAPDAAALQRCLEALQRLHEPVTIHDTDSDSDSDGEVARVVYRPRDLYAHRPLPHIIGSQAWKNKWHAGLLVEDSDSESSTSKNQLSEQYSESDAEEAQADDQERARTISQSSSESCPESARSAPQPVPPELPPVPPVPAIVVKHLYKPQHPATGTIFPDEPPPLEDNQSEESDQGDIFAELHKNQPYNNDSKDRSRLADDLFDFSKAESAASDIFSDFAHNKIATGPHAKEKSVLFEEESEPELFAPKHENPQTDRDTGAIKKPVGGISLFGTNKGAESIGAAILRRNQRRTSSEDEADAINDALTVISKRIDDLKEDATADDKAVAPNIGTQADRPTEKDIFNDLFAKPEKPLGKNVQKIDKKEVKKVDLFGDNLFDDIDDIFTSNVVKKEPRAYQKALFDEDDDLFADIAVTKTIEVSKKISHDKGLFDSDDDLFSDKVKTENVNVAQRNPEEVTQGTKAVENYPKSQNTPLINDVTKSTQVLKNLESIFDNDSDSDIFSDPKTSVNSSNNNYINRVFTENISTDNKLDTLTMAPEETEEIFGYNKDNNSNVTKNEVIDVAENANTESSLKNNNINPASIFDDDPDDIFSDINKPIIKEITSVQSTVNDIVKEVIVEDKADILSIPTVETSYDSPEVNQITSEPLNLGDHTSLPEETEPDIPEPELVKPPTSKFEKDTIGEDARNSIPNEDIFDDIFPSNAKGLDEEGHAYNIPPEVDKVTDLPDTIDIDNKDAFDDIFTEPPAFEKPKESKKSKNVNALFDDDSDDEGLFFKKNDVYDVKPDTFQGKDMFDIFQDEPPAIHVDFTTKTNLEKSDPEDDVSYQTPTKQQIDPTLPEKSLENIDLFMEESMENIPDPIPVKPDTELTVEIKESENGLNPEIDVKDSGVTKINKLKMNFNINVNALLPGASPKKKVSPANIRNDKVEETDGQTISTVNDVPEPKTIVEPTLIKSVSFDGKPESEILDNKLSKERAKIQVKRRPSTRRARREAVRKSAIDLEDSTDNSSSIDDAPKLDTETGSMILDGNEKPDVSAINISGTNTVKDLSPLRFINNTEVTVPKNVISKIVYILNDEDIFNSKPAENVIPVPNEKISEKPSAIDGGDELFKRNLPEDVADGAPAQRKSGERPDHHQNTSSIFGDDEDELLFKNNKTVKKIDILNSDSDEELFTGAKVGKPKLVPKAVVKGSLFGDDDDSDGDLFGVKTKTNAPMPQAPKPPTSKDMSRSTELVFDDPLTLLGDDD